MEEPTKTFDVDSSEFARLPVDLQGNVLTKFDESATYERLILIVANIFESLSLLIFGAFKNAFKSSVFLKQFSRDFGTDERNAGDVVGSVADKRLKIDDLFRRDAPVRHEIGGVVPSLLAY